MKTGEVVQIRIIYGRLQGVYWQVALKEMKLTCYEEYTCWWYTVYHKLYGIIGPVVRNPVVK